MSYLKADSITQTQIKISHICSVEFWCDILVWVGIEEGHPTVKAVYQAVSSEETGEIEFSQIF